MKIEKLAENKIQVVLTTADLSDMDMDIDSLENNSKDLNNFLFLLMERIKEETGFNPYGGQLLMEAFPTENDGLSIMVSKVHNETAKKITRDEFRHIKRIRPRGEKRTADETETDPFYIHLFDDVCLLLRELDEDIVSRGALYFIDDEYCFLLPKNLSDSRSISLLYEFSHRRSYHNLQGVYVKEHGRLIADGGKLVRMARGIKSL